MKNTKILLRRLSFLLALGLLPVLLAGCMPLSGSSDAPSSHTYTKGAVVKGFPPLPLYPKSQVVESYSFGGNMGASFISADGLAKVVNFYSQSLSTLGWEQNLFKQNDSNYLFEIKNEKFTGTVVVNTASDGKKSAISFFVFPRN